MRFHTKIEHNGRTRIWRLDGAGEDVDEMIIPTMVGVLVMMKASIFPSWREVSPAESLCWRAKSAPPKFRLADGGGKYRGFSVIFFYVRMDFVAKGHRETSHHGPTWTGGAPSGVAVPPGRVGAWWVPSGTYSLHKSLYIPK